MDINIRLISELFTSNNEFVNFDKAIISWLLGIIPLSYMKHLFKLLKSNGKARKIAAFITDKLQNIFKDDIWTIRCNRLHDMKLLHNDLIALNGDKSKAKSLSLHAIGNLDDQYDNNDLVKCFDDLDSNGVWMKSEIDAVNQQRSCETNELILD